MTPGKCVCWARDWRCNQAVSNESGQTVRGLLGRTAIRLQALKKKRIALGPVQRASEH